MGEKIQNEIEKTNGWKNETATRADSFSRFLKKYGEDERLESEAKHRHYSFDFQTSGGGLTADEWQGKVKPDEIKVYYEGGGTKKIYIHYPGRNTDVIIDGRALEDYLKE